MNNKFDGLLSTQTPNYETLVIGDNDIPNAKWVLDQIGTTTITEYIVSNETEFEAAYTALAGTAGIIRFSDDISLTKNHAFSHEGIVIECDYNRLYMGGYTITVYGSSCYYNNGFFDALSSGGLGGTTSQFIFDPQLLSVSTQYNFYNSRFHRFIDGGSRIVFNAGLAALDFSLHLIIDRCFFTSGGANISTNTIQINVKTGGGVNYADASLLHITSLSAINYTNRFGFVGTVPTGGLRYIHDGSSVPVNSITTTTDTIIEHDYLNNLNLAGSGVTYGHIDDQTQALYGVKDFVTGLNIGSATTDITSIATGTTNNDKLATQGYVDDNNGADLWTLSGSNIYYNTGNVGIGTASPAYPLDVNGTIRVADGQNIYVGSDTNGLRLHHTSNNSYIDFSTGNLYIRNTGGTNIITSNQDGFVGINNTPSENSYLYINTPNYAITSSGTNYKISETVNIRNMHNIPAGVTDSGYRIGLDVNAFIADSNFLGTLTNNYGMRIQHGAYTGSGSGTVTNSYGIYLQGLEGGSATIANHYGLYQSGSAVKNFFEGDVGIGTTNPSQLFSINNSGHSAGIGFQYNASEKWALRLTGTDDDIGFYDGTSYRFYIDRTTGNVGIGTSSPAYKLDVDSGNDRTTARFTTTDTGTSVMFDVVSGIGELFKIIPDGRVLVPERLGVGAGASSPLGLLDVASVGTPEMYIRSTATGGNDAILHIRGSRTTDTSTQLASILFETNDLSSSGIEMAKIGAVKDTASTNISSLVFSTTSTDGGTPTERMRIKSSGNVGIGTNSPAYPLHVSGAIRSTGDIIANTYFRSADNAFVVGTASSGTIYLRPTAYNSETAQSTFTTSLATIRTNMTVYGTVTASNFILSSDLRLKENITPISTDVSDIEFKEFNFKADKDKKKRYGAIAQEVEKKHPEFVYEDEKGYKQLDYIEILIAKVAQLENRIKELEGR